jgi:hypothetical protein
MLQLDANQDGTYREAEYDAWTISENESNSLFGSNTSINLQKFRDKVSIALQCTQDLSGPLYAWSHDTPRLQGILMIKAREPKIHWVATYRVSVHEVVSKVQSIVPWNNQQRWKP